MLILGFADYHEQGQRLANALGCDYQQVSVHHFPDEESLVRLPTPLPEHVVLVRSLDRPNNKLIELFLCAATARLHGARRVTLVAPYLCYMRQDRENQPGEAVSQKIIGQLLAQHFDDLITVDSHLHRIERLDQAVPLQNAINLTAGELIADYVAHHFPDCLLLGPDSESEQWVSQIARHTGADYLIADKQRLSDKQVQIRLPEKNLAGRAIVIIDDMASTGRTISTLCSLLQQRNAGRLCVLVTHALMSHDAEDIIRQAGISELISTDSISHHSNHIYLGRLLADSLSQISD